MLCHTLNFSKLGDLFMYLEVFLVGLLAGISPGPDFVVVLKNSLGFGRRAGKATAFGIAAALIFHVSYTVLGFAIILHKLPGLFRFIQVLGAIYLIWLGWSGLRSRAVALKEDSDGPGEILSGDKSFAESFRDGFLCNLLNPKAPLFFLSIFAQFLTAGTPGWVRWIYGLETIMAVGGWFILLSFIITSLSFRRIYGRYRHWFDRILGAVLLFFAIRILGSVFKVWPG
jgi:RhtB (resistance to homoserine/threonine) family protein